MLNVGFRTFSGANCPVVQGCTISFDSNSSIQYFPSNVSNFLILLDGTLVVDYADGSGTVETPLYKSNNWTQYQDKWKYNVACDAKVLEGATLASISLLNNTATSANCNLQVKTIQNESFTFSTDKTSVLLIYGSDHVYNGNNINTNGVVKTSGYRNIVGNVATHDIVATGPLTLIFLEKD